MKCFPVASAARAALLLPLALLHGQTPVSVPSSPFGGLEESVAALSEMTGWKPLRKIQHGTMSKEKLKSYLNERVKTEVKPEDIRAEEITLRHFGLIPRDFDLKTTTIDLLTEQAAAFYDYKEKKLYLLEGGDPGAQSVFVFHELAHALADQRFNLGRYIRKGTSDDSSTARTAVLEGQATWLMFEFMARKMGQSLKTSPGLLGLLGRSTADQFSQQYPVLAKAPLYLRESLLFPYTQGLQFQNALVAKLGQEGFARPFRHAPLGSQHILHPELYLANSKPVQVNIPKLRDGKVWLSLTDGTFGEWDHTILMRQFGKEDEAGELASHWRGAAYSLWEDRTKEKVALWYCSEWSTEEAARRVVPVLRSMLVEKKAEWTTDEPETLVGRSMDGMFAVRRQGTRVLFTEGLPAEAFGQ